MTWMLDYCLRLSRLARGLMSACLLGLSSLITLLSPGNAVAADLCNQTSFVIELATGWPVDGGVALEGWTRIRPGECANVATEVDLDGDTQIFYYAKTSSAYLGGVREWRGGIPLCVDESDFELVANTRCDALGLASRDFIMREGDDRERTTLVEPTDFGSRADEAGLQRLLQSAGYRISSIDGYDGSQTRRAVAAFLEDAELATRPSDARLIDALESRALARNASSGLTVCNESGYDISAAYGHLVDDIWESLGWWRMHTGECARILGTRLETASQFFYAERIINESRQTITGGEQSFCYAPSRFLAEGRTNCSDRGYETANFRRIPEPVDGGVRVTLTGDDFGGTGQ